LLFFTFARIISSSSLEKIKDLDDASASFLAIRALVTVSLLFPISRRLFASGEKTLSLLVSIKRPILICLSDKIGH
jgi:hypothetical protein